MLIAQVTDPHIKAEGRLAYKKVDTAENLKRCIQHLCNLLVPPDMVLITGDLTDFGRPEEYKLLRQLLAPLEMPTYVIPGNHDERENFRAAFSDHNYIPKQGEFLHYVVEDYPLRMIGLDTTIPGEAGGEMCSSRLQWLDQQLETKPDVPTLLFMHHPPIKTGIQHMDVQNCANAEALGELLEKHSQVFQILCGHVHRPIHTQWHGVTVTVAPSSSHYVAFDLRGDAPPDFNLEPPTVQLHHWNNDMSLTSHLSFIGQFDGPYPFFDSNGKLID